MTKEKDMKKSNVFFAVDSVLIDLDTISEVNVSGSGGMRIVQVGGEVIEIPPEEATRFDRLFSLYKVLDSRDMIVLYKKQEPASVDLNLETLGRVLKLTEGLDASRAGEPGMIGLKADRSVLEFLKHLVTSVDGQDEEVLDTAAELEHLIGGLRAEDDR